MLILEIILQLKPKQGDITAAFIHAKLEENEKLFVKIPKLFEQYDKHGKGRLLRSKKNIYGLFHSPRSCWEYLTQK